MLFSARIPLKPLAGLCRRLGITLEAGIDIRTVLTREADRAHGRLGDHLTSACEAVKQGEPLSAALAATGDFFPPLFREMIGVGEQTGHLDGVLLQLADHYEHQIALRRSFWSSLIWPLMELGIAIVFIGVVIWFQAMLNVDVFGFGLTGNRGLAIYVGFWAGVGTVVWLALRAIGRGAVWIRPVQRLVLKIPGVGGVLQTMVLSRLAWTMNVTLGGGMEVRRAIRLSIGSAQNAFYSDQLPVIEAEITAGHSIHEAFCRAGGYPVEFLDVLAVGEESGQVPESLGRLARLYQERARDALKTLQVLAGWAVYLLIAGTLIVLIFRGLSNYVNMINSVMPK